MKTIISYLQKLIRQPSFWISCFIMLLAIGVRVIRFGSNPPSLYIDEISIAYDSWSLATTGHDVYGAPWTDIAFQSFGEYKPNIYLYAVALCMKAFGPQDWVVRLPSLLAGIFIVWATGYLTTLLFPKQKLNFISLSHLVMLISAFNPALLHLSRAGFETNLSVAFLLAGIIYLYPSKKLSTHHPFDWSLFIGETFLLVSLYTYPAMRIIAPLIGIYLGVRRLWPLFRRQSTTFWLNISLCAIIALVGAWPMASQLFDPTVMNRVGLVGVLTSNGPAIESDHCYIVLTGHGWWRSIYCHPFFFYTRDIIRNYFDHFAPNYLFFKGDANTRHSIQMFGVYYPIDIIITVLAIVYLIKNCTRLRQAFSFILFWIVIGIIPASLTYETPHLLRTLSVIPAQIMILSFGWYTLYQHVTTNIWKFLTSSFITIIAILSIGIWQLYYYGYYPLYHSYAWFYGYKEAFAALQRLKEKYPDLPTNIETVYGPAGYFYFWYNKISPELAQKEISTYKYKNGTFNTYTPDNINFGDEWNPDEEQLFMLISESYYSKAHPSSDEVTYIYRGDNSTVFVVGHYYPPSATFSATAQEGTYVD